VVLERIATGAAVGAAERAHVDACPTCQQALSRIQADNAFLKGFAIAGALPTAERAGSPLAIEIPGYEIKRELHRGGQGVILLARQRSTKRDVAIKVMKRGPFATSADRARFDREIETLSRLEHPNIVTIHDAGAASGFQYFVMDYIDGRPLDEACTGAHDCEKPHGAGAGGALRGRLELFVKVCGAVHAAHLRGVIHRDLKPGNILVDQAGEPHILDFGLAKAMATSGEAAMTETGQFVGSLLWASPEQIAGAAGQLDLRTDVYALGVVLYQLLTGVVPICAGESLRETLDSILLRTPPRPSQVAKGAGGAGIDSDLDTIVLKCLAKDRELRYQSAGDIARDLRRYLAGEPIEAKRDSTLYVLRKSIRRYHRRVIAVGVVCALLAMLAAVMFALYRQSTAMKRQAVRSAESLAELLAQSHIEQGRAAASAGNVQLAEQLLWDELLTRREPGAADRFTLNDPPGPPEAWWALWELYRRHPCRRTLRQPEARLISVAVTPEGDGIWVADEAGSVRKLDREGRVVDAYAVGASAGRRVVYTDAEGQYTLVNAGTDCAFLRRGQDEPVHEFTNVTGVDSGGASKAARAGRIATLEDGVALVTDLEPPAQVARIDGGPHGVAAVALAGDGRWLATRDRIGGLHVWDVQTGRELAGLTPAHSLNEVLHEAGDLAFAPDGLLIADGWMDSPGRVWRWREGASGLVELAVTSGDRRRMSFSRDGALVAIGDIGGALRVFETREGALVRKAVAHDGRVYGVCFTAGGREVWTCGDHTLRLWDLSAATDQLVVQIAGDQFLGVDVSQDGSWLAVGGRAGVLRRIDRATLAAGSTRIGPDAVISSVAISPDDQRIAVATYQHAAYVFAADDLAEPLLVLAHPNRISRVCFAADGARLATSCDDGKVRIWRAADGHCERELQVGPNRIPHVAFSAGGELLAAAVRDGTLRVWNVATGTGRAWNEPSAAPLRAVRFFADDRRLVAGGGARTVDIWDVPSQQRIARLAGHNQEIFCLDVSSDGSLIASGDAGGTIRLWHANRLRPLATLDGPADPVMAVRFAPDGKTLFSVSPGAGLRIWDLSYYDAHILGNLEAQLLRVDADRLERSSAAAWRGLAATKSSVGARAESAP